MAVGESTWSNTPDFRPGLPAAVAAPGPSFRRALWRTWGHYGAGGVLCEFVYRIVRRTLKVQIGQVLQLELDAVVPAHPTLSDLAYRFLDAEDLRAAAIDPENDLDVPMADRVRSGRDFCFGAYQGNRLVSYGWFARKSVEAEHGFGAALRLPDDVVYMYKVFTLPGYRGRQIHGAVLNRAAEHFRQSGVRRLIAFVEYANWASLRSHQRLGCRIVGRLLRLGRRSFGASRLGLAAP